MPTHELEIEENVEFAVTEPDDAGEDEPESSQKNLSEAESWPTSIVEWVLSFFR